MRQSINIAFGKNLCRAKSYGTNDAIIPNHEVQRLSRMALFEPEMLEMYNFDTVGTN